ncbi:hypothetical protein [Parachryseolinea silvisoli]|uniref:hypothetical protein n=1 Tax=Parachryseolinea silvisoli TaxID=2873601 RepID=UPI002265D578|nr:hypothetical protein [Parachryseolinea silvisoli]MCD9019959.1 hypothetical protein [Parachryseolinea silvisoli]
MINKQKLLSVFALVGILGLASCGSDDDGGSGSQVSKDEAKNKIASFNSTATADLQDLQDIEGLKATQDFFDLANADDPFGRVAADHKKLRSFFREKGKDFRRVFTKGSAAGRTAADEPFNYGANLGKYAWNSDLQQFEMIEEASIISIEFPTEGSTTNNARLELTAYSEVALYDEEWDETYYEPEVLTAALYVDNTKALSIHLEVEWDEQGFPLTADIELTVTPFKLSVAFDTKGNTSNSLNVSLLRNQETVVATSITVNYKDASKSEESVKSIDGYVQLRNLKLQGTINAEGANNSQGEVDLNDFVKLALYHGDQKLADVVFEDENGAAVAYLKYADGSKEKVETALQPVIDEIDAITRDFDDVN